jgi:hypothetical protein
MKLGGNDFRIRLGGIRSAPGHEGHARFITKLNEAELGHIHRGPEIDETVSPDGGNVHFNSHTTLFLAARCREASA